MTGYEVDTAVLRVHAARVGQIAASVGHAADAAKQEGIGGLSPYGVLFSPIAVPVLGTVAALAKQMISGSGELGRRMQESLSSNVDLYELAEDESKSAVNGAGS